MFGFLDTHYYARGMAVRFSQKEVDFCIIVLFPFKD